MRLLQKVGVVLPGKRKADPGTGGAQAPGPMAPPPDPPPAPPANPLPPASPGAETLLVEAPPPPRPRSEAPMPLPEFPDLDLMALLPPELRQAGALVGQAAPRGGASGPAAAKPPADPPEEAASFAAARPRPTPPEGAGAVVRPDPAPQSPPADGPVTASPPVQPPPGLAAPVTGFAAFLAEGLRHLDAPEPGPVPPRALPSIPPQAPLVPPQAPPAPSQTQPVPPQAQPEPGLPASLSLAPAREIAGLVAACLVDSESGLPLAAEGRGPDPDAVAAHGTEVVRAARAAIGGLGLADDLEDMLVTTGRRVLVIRPLRRLPTAFLYLILDRKAANLGMARLQLDRIESGLGP